MEFAAPAALALALLAVPVVWLARRRSRGYAVASGAGFARTRPTLRLRLARMLPVLRVLAVVVLAIAVAGPRRGDANAVVPGQGIDIALALDISGSMETKFGSNGQTRLQVTKDVIREFIKGRTNDRIGLVVFERDALPLAPPTLDYSALDSLVADVENGLLPDGTGIGVGLATALNMLQDSTAASRIVILLTDGQHNANSITPEDAANLAVSLHVRVYTIGVVSPGTVGSTQVDANLLTAMADRTGGRFFSADSPKALADIYDEIGRLETSKVGREHFEQFSELAPWFAAAGAALLALELLLRGTWLRRSPA